MQCSKYARDCDYISKDNDFIFALMPFQKDFDNVFDVLQNAVNQIPDKKYKCTRADEHFTTHSIWCENICKPIRKAKYLIVDITGRNSNVFYELGLSHALENTEAIIITQNIDDAPFDIKDLGLIEYSTDALKELRTSVTNAITKLDKAKEASPYIPKTSDEVIADLKQQLSDEETRSSNFKKERKESEDREQKLKEQLRQLEAIKTNPSEEALKRITELESSIAEYRSKLKYTEDDKKELIAQLGKQLKEKEEKLATLEKEFAKSKQTKDEKGLSELLLDESARNTEALKWFNKAYDSKDLDKQISYYHKVLDLKPDYPEAWNNIGNSYNDKKDFDKAIKCLQKALALKSDMPETWCNLGNSYYDKKNFDKALECYQKAIDLKSDYFLGWCNIGIVYNEKGAYDKAIECFQKALDLKPDDADAWNSIGNSYNRKKDFDKAIECYQKALDIKSDFVAPYIGLGFLYIIIGQLQNASELFVKAVALGNNDAAFMNLGHLSLINKDEVKALVNYKTSLKNYSSPASFFKDFDDDYQYLQQYGITKEHYAAIRKELEDFISGIKPS